MFWKAYTRCAIIVESLPGPGLETERDFPGSVWGFYGRGGGAVDKIHKNRLLVVSVTGKTGIFQTVSTVRLLITGRLSLKKLYSN